MSKKKIKVLIGVAIVVGAVIALFTSISSDNLTYFYTIEEVFQDPDKYKDKSIRIMGQIEKGTVKWSPSDTKLNFRITEDSKLFLNVIYFGSKPDMFREGQGVVIEGTMEKTDLFLATKLLVKHTEEYKAKPASSGKSYMESIK